MFAFSGKKLEQRHESRISRFKIITVFLLGAMCSVLLMLSAVYKGANEYAIKNAIQTNFDLVSVKTQMAFSDIVRILDKQEFISIVHDLSDDELTLYAVVDHYPETIQVANNDLSLSFDQLQSSEQDFNGGYFEQQGRAYIWNLMEIEDQLYPILSISEFSEGQNDIMLSVFFNRLIIPGIFILWLSVWGALMLSRIWGRLYEQSASLEKYITIDPLTGLQNQKQASKTIDMYLNKSHRHNRHLSVLLVMVDNFYELSDDYGQSFSDALILTISQRLNDAVRGYDELLRYRDNVFMLILQDEAMKSSTLIEKRLYQELAQQYEIYGHYIQPGLFIEVMTYPDHIDQDEFIKEINSRIESRLITKSHE